MKIELTTEEIDLIDDALMAWARDPVSSGVMGMLAHAILSKDTPPQQREIDARNQKKKLDDEVAQRERRVLILRAKLQAALDGRILNVT